MTSLKKKKRGTECSANAHGEVLAGHFCFVAIKCHQNADAFCPSRLSAAVEEMLMLLETAVNKAGEEHHAL